MSNNPTRIFPSITPSDDGDPEPFVDDSYSRAELEQMDGNELQSLAAEHPTDAVNGHSTADEIRDALAGAERV
jgi:hypothetical protein